MRRRYRADHGDEHVGKRSINHREEITVTKPVKLLLLATLAITATVSMLSSHAEAGRKGPHMPPVAGLPEYKPNPKMFPKGVLPDRSRINPGLSGQGQLDPQPRPWVPTRQYWSR